MNEQDPQISPVSRHIKSFQGIIKIFNQLKDYKHIFLHNLQRKLAWYFQQQDKQFQRNPSQKIMNKVLY